MNSSEHSSETPSNHGHEFTVIVNGRERTVTQKELTFDEVVVLAFGPPNYDASAYTITYRNGPEKNEKGSLLRGEAVKLKSGMIFNVVRTDKS
jgi:Multiubiquitin